QRTALAGVAIEIGKLLAVLALQQHGLAALRRSLREAAKPLVDIGEPVAFLGEFALVDHIEAELALPLHDGRYLCMQPLLIVGRGTVETRGIRQAADMGGQDLVRAAPHGMPPDFAASSSTPHSRCPLKAIGTLGMHCGLLPNRAAADLTRSARWATHAHG